MVTNLEPRNVVCINSCGRQTASFVRVASQVGWRVRGHVHSTDIPLYNELSERDNVELSVGDLNDPNFLNYLFDGAQVAFINTNWYSDELAIGKKLADKAAEVGLEHFLYSSMPDHSTFNPSWPALPMWAPKFEVEKYIRNLGIPATFLYAGMYNNNFTTRPDPVFQLKLQEDKTLVWQAPFHPDDVLPWLDADHDVGPTLLQICKQGPSKWNGHRIPLAFEKLTPKQVCAAFTRGLGVKVRYRRGPVDLSVPYPLLYRRQLEGIQRLFGEHRAPYFGPTMYWPHEAMELWEAHRDLEAYASEAFLEEERAHGHRWMDDEDEDGADGDGLEQADSIGPSTPSVTSGVYDEAGSGAMNL